MDNWLGLDPRPRLTDEQRSAYERDRAVARSHSLNQTTFTVTLFYLIYAAVDAMLLGDIVWLSLSLRFGLMLPLAMALSQYQMGRRPIARKEAATLAVVLSGNLVWCIVLTASESPAALHYYYAAAVFQMVITIAVRAPLKITLYATLCCFLLNYGFIWFLKGVSLDYVLYHLALYIPTAALTLISSHQLEAERQIAFLQAHENEALKRELSRQNGELERLSVTDPLTQLPNRRGAEAELARLRRWYRAEDLAQSALLLIDIDHFKAFNDNYGHSAGDACLRAVAESMRRELPDAIHLSRHGGEEFLALMPLADSARAGMFAERMRRAVRALAIPHDHTGDRNRHVTISIGIGCGSIADEASFSETLDAADRGLYAVKADGRNGWHFGPPAEGERTDAA
ncbi:diguanylate cyclase domain-containing protein [Rhizobium cremeum]|uniref:GGDEF domain-containing protein n=1 Tax=Rhizobium cremeum TaxID=2813827 RepID=UPI0039E1357E